MVSVEVTKTGLSDHTGQYCTLDMPKETKGNIYNLQRNLTHNSLPNLKKRLGMETWDSVINSNKINLTHGDLDGNRLATFMIYMSDVGWGGHTVFPDLQISVRPKKGAALFWYNLHHDGTIDYRMRHAACPVIVGTKWVLNKWLHEAGQELRYRPPCLCHLNDTRERYYL
ncbi:Prolyl 4-hydroxylase, alpha polypeptide [Homalodisca vitripennis]|nr:Prolyl 4-hydroxylase, alpha polypeptide [Homalodisca vitripennis]